MLGRLDLRLDHVQRRRRLQPAQPGAALDDRAMADHRNDADNTGINKRDRNDTVTPIDQGNDARDTKITAAIRKWMMSDTTLSFAAKNVKIITIDSKVTLRGPVKSDREKSTIEAMAKQTDGVREVDDQIEVKGQ